MKTALMMLLLACTAFSEGVTFLSHGKSKAVLSLEEIKSKIKPKDITVWEPHEDKEATYTGFDFKELLNFVYGSEWKKEEEILFTCTDGYQPSVPVSRFLEHNAYLVFERKKSSFILKDRFHNEEVRDLSPYYLVWDNLKDKEIKADGPAGWPWALASLDLIEFSEKFPKLSPPKKSKESVKKGFLLFRARCLSCHSINGEGGTKGVELNSPHSVTEYFNPKFLRQWILDPSSVRANATMPKFNRDSADWNENLNAIIDYLKAMAKTRPVIARP